MKLSEAMRKGAAETKPTIGQLTYEDYSGTRYACAIGAIYVGLFGWDACHKDPDTCLVVRAPTLSALDDDIDDGSQTLRTAIVIMNDSERKTREDIARWLEDQGL